MPFMTRTDLDPPPASRRCLLGILLLVAGAAACGDPRLEPRRFVVFGDFGVDNGDELRVAQLVKSLTPDFIVTTGDNNYPAGEAATIDHNIGKYYAEYIGGYQGAFGPGSPDNRFWPAI